MPIPSTISFVEEFKDLTYFSPSRIKARVAILQQNTSRPSEFVLSLLTAYIPSKMSIVMSADRTKDRRGRGTFVSVFSYRALQSFLFLNNRKVSVTSVYNHISTTHDVIVLKLDADGGSVGVGHAQGDKTHKRVVSCLFVF